jgi:hypothetical protein
VAAHHPGQEVTIPSTHVEEVGLFATMTDVVGVVQEVVLVAVFARQVIVMAAAYANQETTLLCHR